jgi:ferritin-like metal-binding protein YciE
MTDAQELLKHDLGDILYAEKQILKALKPMIRETSDPRMKARLEQHQSETEQQIGNVERAFEAIGERPRGQKCPGILGIIEEKKEFQEEEEPTKAVLEAFNLGAGLRVEHYEIAAYQSAISLATALGRSEVASLLSQNLEQELAMARFIEESAASVLESARAMMQAEAAEEAAGGRGGSRRGSARGGAAKRGAAKKGAAKKGAAKKGATKKSAATRGGGRTGGGAKRTSRR